MTRVFGTVSVVLSAATIASGLLSRRASLLQELQTRILPPRLGRPLLPPWVAATVGTAAIALLVTFALSGRILRPVSELIAAARRMRAGDLEVRVRPSGDDEIARLGRAFNDMAERLAQTERVKRQMVTDVAHALR